MRLVRRQSPRSNREVAPEIRPGSVALEVPMPVGSGRLRRRLAGWQPAGVLTVSEVLGGQRRFRAVSGVYRNTRQEDLLWFAFRQPQEWVHLDVPERLNGTMHVQVSGVRRALLVVDGAVAGEIHVLSEGERSTRMMGAVLRPNP